MNSDRKWVFDQKAVNKAREKLGIEKPVSLRAVNVPASLEGQHGYKNGTHLITVSKYLEPEEANQATWHELTHALQFERDFDCISTLADSYYSTMMVELGCYDDNGNWTVLPNGEGYEEWLKKYYEHPMEKEALKNERYLAWRYPLVKSCLT